MAPKSPNSPSKSRAAPPRHPRQSSFPNDVSDTSHGDEGSSPPKRAQTLPEASIPEKLNRRGAAAAVDGPDVFETSEQPEAPEAIEVTRPSLELDELPIELVTLIDSFLESLEAKVHATPPNIDKLSRRFQDFYAVASSHINTHVSALASRQSRDASPARSVSSISSAASRLRSTLGSNDNVGNKNTKPDSEQQMITAEELEARKAARRAVESKRGLLEEAVERRLCERIYHRIYRHRSTEDEALDDMLRSKTAALALIGIRPSDLGLKGIDAQLETTYTEDSGDEKQTTGVNVWLGTSTKELIAMSTARYPLSKLSHLKTAHKNIVDTLAATHPSASADDILPVLILALTTVPPESLHVVSDLHFIQYFRWEPKLTGEAAYCLTNLEASISFLQALDLATLRGEENAPGPVKNHSNPGVPNSTNTFPPAYSTGSAAESALETDDTKLLAPMSGIKAATILRNRRLSDLVNSPAQAFGLASDAVLNTADQSLKNISNSLGDSYKFLLGKLKDRQEGPKEPIAVPRTLDDARKLVSTPEEDVASGLASGDDIDYLNKYPWHRDERVLSIIGGRRDRSADSARSGRSASSSKKVLFAEDSRAAGASHPSPAQTPAVLEQVRNLGSTFNPMARLSSFGRGIARNIPTPVGSPSLAKPAASPAAEGGDLGTAFPDIAAALPPKRIPKIAPPNKRFMELQNPGDLKLAEVLDLLRDYRRLAGALKNIGAFEEK